MPRLLGELLREQQEPFVLEAYLLERGYLRSIKPFKSLQSRCLKKRMHSVPYCPKSIKSLISQLMTANDTCMIKNTTNGGWINSFVEKWNGRSKTATKLSISSGATKFNTPSDSNMEDARFHEAEVRKSQYMKHGSAFIAKEVCSEGKVKWGGVEDSKQLSPVSVLQEIGSDEGSPVNERKSNFKASSQGESSVSTFQHKSKQQQTYSNQGSHETVGLDSYSQYIINKRTVKKTKQLLIDCVREVLEHHRKRDSGKEQMRKGLGADEVWKLVCEKVWQWSQESIDETTVLSQHHDFLDGENCGNNEQQKMEISVEIGEVILGDVISEMLGGVILYPRLT